MLHEEERALAERLAALIRNMMVEEQMGPQAYTVSEFCIAHRISLSTWHAQRKAGKGPRVMQIGSQFRVAVEAAKEWRAQREKEAASKAAQLEHRRRAALASKAGKIAGASPLHVCRRGPGRPRKTPATR
jgi:hypothetical protein